MACPSGESHIQGKKKLYDIKTTIINKFKEDIINNRKEMGILDDEDYWIINMDEISLYVLKWVLNK